MMPSGETRPEVCWAVAGITLSAVTASPALTATPPGVRVVQPVKAVAVALLSLQSTVTPSTVKWPGCSKAAVLATVMVTPSPPGPAGTVTAAVAVVLPPMPTGSAAGRPASGLPSFGVRWCTIRLVPGVSPEGRERV